MRLEGISDLIDRLEGDVALVFAEAVTTALTQADFKTLIRAIELGDADLFADTIGLAPELRRSLRRSLRDAYAEAGDLTVEQFSRASSAAGTAVTVGFDETSERAVRYLQTRSSTLITNIDNSSRTLIRERLALGVAEGTPPRSVAVELVGRISRNTGRRVGGLVGLTPDQASSVLRAEQELRSGNYRAFLGRELRDKRSDAKLLRLVKSGGELSEADIVRLSTSYSNKTLLWRGENIARSEMLESLYHAQDEGLEQMVEQGRVSNGAITEIWDASNDGDTRESHIVMDGQRRKRGFPFQTGAGHQLKYPGDKSLGAPASETNQCRCRKDVDIDFSLDLQ